MGQRNFSPPHRRAVGRTLNPKQAWDNLYNHDWEKYRNKYLKINDRCYACGFPSTVVDHLIPHRGDIKLFVKTDNHIPMCSVCHNKVTGLFDRRHREGHPITNKLKWLSHQRAVRSLTFRVKVMPSYP